MSDRAEFVDTQVEQIGRLADKADNYVAASHLPIQPAMHLRATREGLAEIAKELKEIYVAITGRNPEISRSLPA